jgi:hypothetical protein
MNTITKFILNCLYFLDLLSKLIIYSSIVATLMMLVVLFVETCGIHNFKQFEDPWILTLEFIVITFVFKWIRVETLNLIEKLEARIREVDNDHRTR